MNVSVVLLFLSFKLFWQIEIDKAPRDLACPHDPRHSSSRGDRPQRP